MNQPFKDPAFLLANNSKSYGSLFQSLGTEIFNSASQISKKFPRMHCFFARKISMLVAPQGKSFTLTACILATCWAGCGVLTGFDRLVKFLFIILNIYDVKPNSTCKDSLLKVAERSQFLRNNTSTLAAGRCGLSKKLKLHWKRYTRLHNLIYLSNTGSRTCLQCSFSF